VSNSNRGQQTVFGPCMTKTLWIKFKPVQVTLTMIEREYKVSINENKEYEVVMALGDKMVVNVDGIPVDVYPRHVTIARTETLRIQVDVEDK